MSSRQSLLFLASAFSFSLLACREPASGLSSGGSQGSNSRVSWSQYADPFERAFSLEVPAGWTVQGGLFRMGYTDQRPMVNMRSPDGQIEIRIGDVSVPSYTPPNAYHAREGEVYDLGAQARMIVARYRTGPEFAILYSHARFARQCKNPRAPSTQMDFTMPDYIPVSGYQKSSAGQIAYACQTDAGPRMALAFTRTALANGVWQAPTIISLLAPPDRVEFARGIALHSAQSLRINPEWTAYQQQMDNMALQYQRWRQGQIIAELGQQIKQFEARMSAMQNQVNAFERHQAAFQGQVDQFSNALNGLTPTTDPLTGENRTVWTGTQDHYWANGLGQVVNSHDMPSSSYHQIQ